MSEFEKWAASEIGIDISELNRWPVVNDWEIGWHARDPEVAELKRKLAEANELMPCGHAGANKTTSATGDGNYRFCLVCAWLSEARDAALVEVAKAIHDEWDNCREYYGQGCHVIDEEAIERLRQGKEKG